jgi:hypothetical protein
MTRAKMRLMSQAERMDGTVPPLPKNYQLVQMGPDAARRFLRQRFKLLNDRLNEAENAQVRDRNAIRSLTLDRNLTEEAAVIFERQHRRWLKKQGSSPDPEVDL